MQLVGICELGLLQSFQGFLLVRLFVGRLPLREGIPGLVLVNRRLVLVPFVS